MAGEFRKTNERCTPRNMILFIANQQQLHEKQIYYLWSKRNRSTSHNSSNSSNSIGTCSFKLCGRHIQKYHEIFPSKTKKGKHLFIVLLSLTFNRKKFNQWLSSPGRMFWLLLPFYRTFQGILVPHSFIEYRDHIQTYSFSDLWIETAIIISHYCNC